MYVIYALGQLPYVTPYFSAYKIRVSWVSKKKKNKKKKRNWYKRTSNENINECNLNQKAVVKPMFFHILSRFLRRIYI